jgi:transcriptional regulator with XRE-family HTH domain
METIGNRIQRLREEQGLSVVGLASAVGVSPGAIHQLERGNVKVPNLLFGCRLANVLCVDPMYLALGEGASWSENFAHLDARVRALERHMNEQRRQRR